MWSATAMRATPARYGPQHHGGRSSPNDRGYADRGLRHVGAQEGYIYVRAGYPLAIERLKLAIAQAEKAGFLGDNILGTDFCFRLHINREAPAPNLLQRGAAIDRLSIEGKRGMPASSRPALWSTACGRSPRSQQRGDLRQLAHDHSARRGVVPGIGTPEAPAPRRSPLTGSVLQRRSDRGPHGHDNTALCGLGKSAPKPVISTLNAFRDSMWPTFGTAAVLPASAPSFGCTASTKCKGCSSAPGTARRRPFTAR